MLTALVLASILGQCPGGSCRLPAYRPAPAYAAPAPAPRLYRLTDTAGQTWQHADPAYLSAFVARRNSDLAAIRFTPSFVAPSPCAGGSCRRR